MEDFQRCDNDCACLGLFTEAKPMNELLDSDRATICISSAFILPLIYTIARLAIITIAFTSLREMTADVYITTWATYLPSIQ